MTTTSILALVALLQPQQAQDRTVIREWSYYPNQNSIETIPGGVHVWHSLPGPTDGHSYGVLRLDFPLNTLTWEIELRVRFGELGSVPARLELRAGGRRFFALAAGARMGDVSAQMGDRQVYSDKADDTWRNVRIEGSEAGISVTVNGREVGVDADPGVPDILIFGGVKGLMGRQSEAWLKVDSIQYKLLSGGAGASTPRQSPSNNLSIELATLKQAAFGQGDSTKGWRWIAGAKIGNFGKSEVDLASLPSIRLSTEDYREHLLLPLRWDEALQMHVVRTPGQRLIRPGESILVEFVSGTASPIPAAKPVRAEWVSGIGSVRLKLPPP